MVLKDSYGRPILNLRVAVTQRCNLSCAYCHREGERRSGVDTFAEMTSDEIVRLVEIAADLGMSRVKLTGGEPLMRKDIVEIFHGIAAIPRLEDISMTTNGTMLASLARKLHESGLERVNINIPTIEREVYNKLTGGRLRDVLEGVGSAVESGLHPVKLNMLILRGINDKAVPEMIDFARETGTILQLMELEQLNMSDRYYSTHHESLGRYETMLKENALEIKTRKYMQNRRIYNLADVTVEIVHPIDNTEFCMHCTRLRMTSDGKLKPCLMRNDNLVDVLTPLRSGADEKEVKELFELANQKREPYNKD